MRTRNVLLSMVVGLSVASCGENQPPATTAKPALADPKPYGLTTPVAEAPVESTASLTPPRAESKAVIPPSPVAPSGAQWTIACDTIEGPAHVAEAEMQKQRLIQMSHMPDWYAIHSEGKSDIYYGYYGKLDDPAEKRRQEADRARIAGLLDRLGNPMVRGAIMSRIAMVDPVAPPEWNLLNTPKDAYWTIEIATFLDRPDRKQMAVETVRYYREQEHLNNVYYYHGPTVSSVCIGDWKRDAVAEQGTRPDAKGNMRDDASTQSPDQPLLVIPDVVPANMPAQVLEPGTNKRMAVQALKLDVRDPDMKAAMIKYHDHWVNGYAQGQEENGKFVANPSFLVAIPHDEAPALTADNWRLAGAQRTPTAPEPRPQSAGDDVLRSIGGR